MLNSLLTLLFWLGLTAIQVGLGALLTGAGLLLGALAWGVYQWERGEAAQIAQEQPVR